MDDINYSKKGGLEIEQLGKLILAGILLVVLIVIVGVYIGSEMELQSDRIGDILSF